jgi:NAD(P)-dependent dehydrogenase (short-subunit alcohol dehydrogenase family)
LVCDITHDEAIKTALETGIGHFGGLDILISNAGEFSTQ